MFHYAEQSAIVEGHQTLTTFLEKRNNQMLIIGLQLAYTVVRSAFLSVRFTLRSD